MVFRDTDWLLIANLCEQIKSKVEVRILLDQLLEDDSAGDIISDLW